MITEDYVSFETAKLLKEKGFDEYCKSVYHVGSICSVVFLEYHNNEGYGELIDEKQNSDFGKYDNAISAPTLQMVMKWLRENYNIHIEVRYFPTPNIYRYVIIHSPATFENIDSHPQYFNTHEEACEAGIKYCLENLI